MPRTKERGRGFRGDGLVKGYDEMNAEQRLCFDAGYMAAQRDAKAEQDALREALENEPERWSFGTLVRIAETLLEANYPPEIFNGSSGDPGPAFVTKLRDALAEVRR